MPSAPLANGATYTVVVKGGAAGVLDTLGDAMAADFTSTFTTAVAVGSQSPVSIFGTSAVPSWIDNPDNQAVELGMKFRSDLDGFITGMRFYKSANNIGQHVANLWGPDGTLLGSGTFVNETASGWQTVDRHRGQHHLHCLVSHERGQLLRQHRLLLGWQRHNRPTARLRRRH